MRRTSASSMPTVCSAADTTFPYGALHTMIPRREHASTSTLSIPTPARPMMRRRGAWSSSSTVTAVPERVISPSYSLTRAYSVSRDGRASSSTSTPRSRR